MDHGRSRYILMVIWDHVTLRLALALSLGDTSSYSAWEEDKT